MPWWQRLDDWFIVIMGILCPITIVLMGLAILPSPSAVKRWWHK